MSGIKAGELDIGDQILDNEYKIRLLIKIVQRLIDKAAFKEILTQDELNRFKREAEREMKEKYPNAGLELK